ncbi:MAG TPA: M42 family metallopeptidase [Candidatus Acidoferrales bacterium]|nr:M42 family metallopeptidase [Candidatus Acidoferrales bacterium]
MNRRGRARVECIAAVAAIFSLFCFAPSVRAQDETQKLFAELTDAPGPSGFEEPVAKIMVGELQPYTKPITFDGLGSLIAAQGSTGPHIMLDAHMDELGGMIRRVTPQGFLTMQMLGGWLDQALVDQRWQIIGSKGPVLAVTGIRDAHITPPEERARVFPRDSLFLDVGAKSQEEVKALGIEPGDPVVPDTQFTVLNGTQNYLAKAWDDRIGCAVLIEVARQLASHPHPNQVFYAATVQEEIGLRGAQTAAEVIKPDIGIALEVGIVKDVPGVHLEEAQEALGGGPGVFLYDNSELPNRKLVALIRDVAARKSIPLQYDLVVGYGDDSAVIQKSNGGVPTVNLVVPTRYTHSHNGIINRGDFDRMVDLVTALIESLDAGQVARLRSFAPAP